MKRKIVISAIVMLCIVVISSGVVFAQTVVIPDWFAQKQAAEKIHNQRQAEAEKKRQ